MEDLRTARPEEPKVTVGPGKLFDRDINYLRDLLLIWPFVIFSIYGVACSFSASNRHVAIRCAGLAIVALALARERLLMFLAGLGFCAIQTAIALVVHPWRWPVFVALVLTGTPFLLAYRRWERPKLGYQIPTEFGAADMLLSFASICVTLLLFYVINLGQ